MDVKNIDDLDYLGEYTIDDLGLDSLSYELRLLAAGKNAKIFMIIQEVETGWSQNNKITIDK